VVFVQEPADIYGAKLELVDGSESTFRVKCPVNGSYLAFYERDQYGQHRSDWVTDKFEVKYDPAQRKFAFVIPKEDGFNHVNIKGLLREWNEEEYPFYMTP
jgi:hypothetical protein